MGLCKGFARSSHDSSWPSTRAVKKIGNNVQTTIHIYDANRATLVRRLPGSCDDRGARGQEFNEPLYCFVFLFLFCNKRNAQVRQMYTIIQHKRVSKPTSRLVCAVYMLCTRD